MSVYVFELSVAGFWKPSVGSSSVSSPSCSFHCLQATWQARHPMQLVMSIRVVRIGTGFEAADALGVVMTASPSPRAGAAAFTTLTRQAFVSWVPAPGSEASIVRWLTLGPVERPWKPQL